MKNVIIIGSGGHGRVVADIVRAAGDSVAGFLDDSRTSEEVLGTTGDYAKFASDDTAFVIAVGNARIRERLSASMNNCKWYTAIHPSAVISPDARIGEGTVIAPNAVVNSGASIGRHCIVNTAAVVEHDNMIEDFVHVSVGAKLGGTVSIGRSTWVGIGAVVSNNISVCGGCMLGAGTVVVRDITQPGKYIGVPARLMDVTD